MKPYTSPSVRKNPPMSFTNSQGLTFEIFRQLNKLVGLEKGGSGNGENIVECPVFVCTDMGNPCSK